MTTDPCPVPHPSVPNVRDLAGEVATLRRHLDVLVIALARKAGVDEPTIRNLYGLPAGNPWATRRAEQAQEAPQPLAQATIYTFRHPAHTADQNGPQIEDYAI